MTYQGEKVILIVKEQWLLSSVIMSFPKYIVWCGLTSTCLLGIYNCQKLLASFIPKLGLGQDLLEILLLHNKFQRCKISLTQSEIHDFFLPCGNHTELSSLHWVWDSSKWIHFYGLPEIIISPLLQFLILIVDFEKETVALANSSKNQ